jgi:hypothetical protein
MKNKFSIFNFKLFSYLRQLISNEYPDSKSAVEKRKVVVENNLRWQDDGGPVVEITIPIDQTVGNDTIQPTDKETHDGDK